MIKLSFPALEGGFLTTGPLETSPRLFFFIYTILFVYFYFGCARLLWLSGFTLVVANGGYSLVAVRGLLFAVASLAVEHRLEGTWTSVVGASRL